jgi:hypothetical protein
MPHLWQRCRGQGEPVCAACRLPPLRARVRSVRKVGAFAAGSPPSIVPLTEKTDPRQRLLQGL